MTLKTIDAHVGGQALRLVIDGFPLPHGKDMIEKRDSAIRNADSLRKTLMLEPRGHADMMGAFFTEAVSPGSHAGLLFLSSHGFPTMSVHSTIGATLIAL